MDLESAGFAPVPPDREDDETGGVRVFVSADCVHVAWGVYDRLGEAALDRQDAGRLHEDVVCRHETVRAAMHLVLGNITVVDCGQNLQRIGCPQCGTSIGTEWWADLLEAHCDDGFATLAVVVPCCGAATSLDELEYDWPCGFARFEIAIWNPERVCFGDGELTAIGDTLGHPVQQVRAHI